MTRGSGRRHSPAFAGAAARRRALRQMLLIMAEADRWLRAVLACAADDHPRQRALHESNADRLAAIIESVGWPSTALVGEEGAAAAWLIALHATSRPAFQRQCLHHLYQAAGRGEVPAWQPAHLLDRVRVREGRPQVYGTQLYRDDDGRLRPLPIEDPARLDQRRTGVGLPPLERVITEESWRAASDGGASCGHAGERPYVARRVAAVADFADDSRART